MLHALRDKSADYCNCNSSNKPLRCKVGREYLLNVLLVFAVMK